MEPMHNLPLSGSRLASQSSRQHRLGLLLTCSAALGIACQSCLLPAVHDRDPGAGGQSSPHQDPTIEAEQSLPEGISPEATCVADESNRTVCRCPDGYKGDGQGPNGCVDIDECAAGYGGCDTSPAATCINNIGAAASCRCPNGTVGNGFGANGCSAPSPTSTSNGLEAIPCGRFLCQVDEVHDPTSGLSWQRTLPRLYEGCSGRYVGDRSTTGATCSWQDAANYCAGLSLGSNDYRLPTRDELLSLVDSTRTSPSIDPTAFPDTPSILFWSSSQQDTSGNMLGVHFSFGNSYGTQFTSAAAVRCVQ